MRLGVNPNHYYETYDTLERFSSYWYQIKEIISNNPRNILEIGIGNGFVSKYLKNRGLDVLTSDIDKRLNPVIVNSVCKIPFSDETFDLVACYEVLEHLPFKYFKTAISEISRVSRSRLLLSLPDENRIYRIYIQIPKLGVFKKIIPIPRLRKIAHHFDGQHYWEIGKSGYSLKTIVKNINEAGLKIIRSFRPFEKPNHRFFVLKKETVYL
ncbi:class I SAM-dependent methyltransferase [Thermoproteota archaeon]